MASLDGAILTSTNQLTTGRKHILDKEERDVARDAPSPHRVSVGFTHHG